MKIELLGFLNIKEIKWGLLGTLMERLSRKLIIGKLDNKYWDDLSFSFEIPKIKICFSNKRKNIISRTDLETFCDDIGLDP